MINRIKFLLIIFVFGAVGCTQHNSDVISEQVSDIGKKNIPDKRLMYWDIDLEIKDGQTTLKGATASENSFNDLKSLAEQKSIGFDIELLPTDEFKANPWGIVTLSVCNIRREGTHSAELLSQALMGTPVKVYTKVDGWYLIQTPDRYFGWVDATAIALKTNAELVEWKNMDKVLYNRQNGWAFSSASDKSAVECDLVLADLLSISASEKEYHKILLADGREVFVKKEECISLDIWKNKNVSVPKILETAFGFKGLPYLWGGTSAKMTDCSGFTKSVYYFNGILLQRDASQQTFYGELVDTENGYENLQAGDLVFFGRNATDEQDERVTHVGLCTGNQEFIHASGRVRINSLNKESDKYKEHYKTAFVRARRVIGNVNGQGIEWIVDNEFYKEILP
uniref:C40 family peptidase n=1 Tax=uncultured Draconibacterium sp. TaxID=1573823 RepID=UPI003216AB70